MILKNSMKLKVMLTLIALSVYTASEAQEMFGLTNTAYSGLSGLSVNPANISINSTGTEVSLFTFSISGENNIFYIKDKEYDFLRFFEKNPDFPRHGLNNNFATYFLADNKNKKFIFFNSRIVGPSVLFHYKQHSFAFQIELRSAFSINRMSIPLAANLHSGFIVSPKFNIGELKSAGLLWGSTNLSYSYKTRINDDVLSFGISLKKLSGYVGEYFINNNMDYESQGNSTLIINNFSGEYAYSLPLEYQNNDFSSEKIIKGSGFAFDLGIVFVKRIKKRLAYRNNYNNKYKIGISLLDIGKIKYKNKVNKYIFDNSSAIWPAADSFIFNNLYELDSTIISKFSIPNENIYRNSDFSIFLPSALSIQIDYNISNNWYINTSLVQAFNLGKINVRRLSLVSLIPRYETKNFAVQSSISYYEQQYTRFGFAVRIYSLTIGSGKVTGFFNYDDFTGLDFYLSLSFNESDFKSLKKLFSFKRRSPCYDLSF